MPVVIYKSEQIRLLKGMSLVILSDHPTHLEDCCIDTNQKSISFYKNGKLVVIMNPLSNSSLANEEGPYFPCLALFKGKVEVNIFPSHLEPEFQPVGIAG